VSVKQLCWSLVLNSQNVASQVKAQASSWLDNSCDSDALDKGSLGNARSTSRRTLERISFVLRFIDAYSRIWITLREEGQSPRLVFCDSKLGEKHTIDMPIKSRVSGYLCRWDKLNTHHNV